MNRASALQLLDRLHEAQNDFYGGGSGAGLDRLLADDITWIVPGENRIAGIYHGLEAVLDYFRLRRDIANRTFRMTRRDLLVGEGSHLAALTDGRAVTNGTEHRWSTVGLYEVADERISTCWLLPLDQPAFDAVWGD
jgi:ketosteroid isomerase-like protein